MSAKLEDIDILHERSREMLDRRSEHELHIRPDILRARSPVKSSRERLTRSSPALNCTAAFTSVISAIPVMLSPRGSQVLTKGLGFVFFTGMPVQFHRRQSCRSLTSQMEALKAVSQRGQAANALRQTIS